MLKAQELLGLSLGLAFKEFRDHQGPFGRAFVDGRLEVIDATDAAATARLLREGLAKLPERKGPQYTPEARFEILTVKLRTADPHRKPRAVSLFRPIPFTGYHG